MKHGLLLAACGAFSLPSARAQTVPAPSQLAGPPLAAASWPGNTSAFTAAGWRFATTPLAEAVDDKSGAIRFRLVVNETGTLDSVITVNSTVSTRQEALCRKALWAVRFVSTTPTPGRARGYYTFRFQVRDFRR